MAQDVLNVLKRLPPEVFEQFVVQQVLPAIGFTNIVPTGGPYDKGCDAIAIKNDYTIFKYCIQVKRYSSRRVGSDDIRLVLYGMNEHNCDRGLIITTSEVTGGILSDATKHHIEIIPGSVLAQIVLKYGLKVPLVPMEEPERKHEEEKRRRKAGSREDEEEDDETLELTKVKDLGIHLPLSFSEAVERAKEKLSKYGEAKLVDATIVAKRLYIFVGKASFKVPGKGRRSLKFKKAFTLDGEEIDPDVVLERTVPAKVKYVSDRDSYLKVKEKVKESVMDEVPREAEDVTISVEDEKLAWILDHYEFTFKVGYTEALVTVGEKKVDVKIGPLTEQEVMRIADSPKVTRKKDGSWVAYREDEKYVYEIYLNEVGLKEDEVRTLRGDYAAKLVKDEFRIAGTERLRRAKDHWEVDVLYNGYHYMAKVNDEGVIVEKLVVPDLSVVRVDKAVEAGYNYATKRPVFKVDEGSKFVYYAYANGTLIKVHEENKGFLTKILGSLKRPKEAEIDTKDPLDLL
ncbi:MAG: restriction endonuclease [Thermoprotei archaeon]